jgi:hypothetical protein
MRSRGGTRSVGVVVAQVLATCTNQSSRRALVIECYARSGAHKTMLRTWSFVLKQRGLGHEGGERVRRNNFFSISATRFALRTAQCMRTSSARCGPERTGVFSAQHPQSRKRRSCDCELDENRASLYIATLP